METINEISAGLASAKRGDREAALAALLSAKPGELGRVDGEAVARAIRNRPLDEVKERLAFEFEGLEIPLDPDEADRMRLEPEPGVGDEEALESMEALSVQDGMEAEDG